MILSPVYIAEMGESPGAPLGLPERKRCGKGLPLVPRLGRKVVTSAGPHWVKSPKVVISGIILVGGYEFA